MTEKKTEEKKSGSSIPFIATVVGAVAAGYFLYGPKAAENKVKIKAWTLKAKAEILEYFEKKQEVTEDQYKEIVDKVTAKYSKLKTVGEEEALKLNRELKKHWKGIKEGVEAQPVKKGKK